MAAAVADHRADAVRAERRRRHWWAGGQWQTVAQLIYRVGWKNLNLGYAAAMSWALFGIIVIFAALNATVINRVGGGRK